MTSPVVTGVGERIDCLIPDEKKSNSSPLVVSITENPMESNNVLEHKKQTVTERLKKRDEERVEALLQRKTEKENAVVTEETTEYFRKRFAEIKDKIDDSLSKVTTVSEASRSTYLDDLVVMAQSLQKLLTDSTQFLSSYNVQSAQDSINHLKESIEVQRATLVPKKKFAFKGGMKKTATEQDATDLSIPSYQPALSDQVHLKTSSADLFGFNNRINEDLTLTAAELSNKKVHLSMLKNCNIRLHGSMMAATFDKLTDCTLSCGPVSGSVFIDDCKACQISVACQQLRVHSTTDTTFYIHVTSRAIIEDCTRILTAPYTAAYDGIDQHYKDSGLDRARNTWNDMDDFNWLAKDKASPNWAVLEQERRREWK